MATSAVKQWDAQGNPLPANPQSSVREWDADGNPVVRDAPAPPEPGFLEPHGGPLSVGDVFRGGASGLAALVNPSTYSGMAKNIRNILHSYRMVGGVPVPVPNEAGAQELVKQGQDLVMQAKEHPGYTAAQVLAPIAAGEGARRIIPPALRRGSEIISGTGPKVTKDLVESTKAANKVGTDKAAAAKAVEDQRTDLTKTVQETSKDLLAKVETARKNALEEGNKKYDVVHEELNSLPADMEKVHQIYREAADTIGDVQAEPAIIRRLGKSLEEGTPLTYADEQKLYSELGRELSKGTLPGGTYHAYDMLHEGIGEDMQRLADSRGLGPQLRAARDYWRHMKQTFGKPYVARDAASKTVRSIAPEAAKRDAADNAMRNLSKYDADIPDVANKVTDARKGLKGLPKAQPTEFTPKTIGEEEVKTAKKESLAKRANTIEHRGSWVAAWPLFHVMSSIMRGELPSVAGTAMESLGTYGAVRSVAGILRNPKVVEFLTNATPRDIEQIPPDLRGSFPSIVQTAQQQGIKVSPALLGALTASQPRKHPTFSAASPVQ